MTTIVTMFPLDLPRLPGVGRVVRHLTESSSGKVIAMEIDGEEIEAKVVSIVQVPGGFEITTEIEEMNIV